LDDILPVESTDATDATDASVSEAANSSAPVASAAGQAVVQDGGLAAALSQLNATMSAFGERLAVLEARSAAPATPPPAAPVNAAPQAAPEFDFANPVASIQQHATAAASAEAGRIVGQLAPFLESVATSLTQNGIKATREMIDAEIGVGAFDKFVSADLNEALAKLSPAQRANPQYVDAIASGILGGKLRSVEGRKELRDIMQSRRPTPPVVLSGGSAVRPQPGRLTPEERQFVADVQRSGIDFSEKDYLASRDTPRTEEARGATWMKPTRGTTSHGVH
jgi:hypothetical protein